MLFENIAAQIMVFEGHMLNFYATASREDSASGMELDFLIPPKNKW